LKQVHKLIDQTKEVIPLWDSTLTRHYRGGSCSFAALLPLHGFPGSIDTAL